MGMEVKINVPESLAEIKLKDYQKFLKIERDNDNTQFILEKMVEIFCKIPGSVVAKMSHKDFTNISNHLIQILQDKPEFQETFTMGGVEYGFIPNIYDDIQVREYVDLDSFLSNTDNLHKSMGVMFRPVTVKKGGKYQIEEYEPGKYDKVMEDAPMDIVSGALLFFYRLGNQLLRITPKYLHRVAKENKTVLDSEKNGGGINTYINSLEETSSTLIAFLNANLERHLFSLRTIKTSMKK